MQLAMLVRIMREAGHDARGFTDASAALAASRETAPDLLVTDLVMKPNEDGVRVCRMVRADPLFDDVRIAILSSKTYSADQHQARSAGADGYVLKSSDTASIVDALVGIASDRLRLRYWGVRGTLPASGPGTARYGGHTSCVSIEAPDNRLLVFDAGSGIQPLGAHVAAQKGRRSGHIFISHPHWDHINAIPFFAPFYQQGNEFTIWAARQGELSARDLVEAQMKTPWFPITSSEFAANVEYRDLSEGSVDAGGITVQAMRLMHPGTCLGFRVTLAGRSICYITDNELYPPGRPEHNAAYVEQLRTFVAGTDVLITDTTYTDEEYARCVGWGHSCVGQVVDLAHAANVGELHLFHHDPNQDDDAIDRKLGMAADALRARGSSVKVVAPAAGDIVELTRKTADRG